jgi:transposase
MVQEGQVRKKYPSDLTDEQWAIVEPMLPPAKQGPRGGRPRQVTMREVLHTLLSLHRSGCQWDMWPHDLLPKRTVYDSFVQWRDDGTWAQAGRGLARADAGGCRTRAHASCRVHGEAIGQDHRDGRPRAGVGGRQADQRAHTAAVGRDAGLVAGRAHSQCRS